MLCKQGSKWRSQAMGVALGVLALCGSVQAGTFWYVDDDAPADGDGLTWETGYQFLQDALAVAQTGDEIHVAQGTYHPDDPGDTGDRDATFTMKNGVTMKGGFAGLGAEDPDERDPDLYPTILSGDLAADDEPDFVNYAENSYHVVTASGADETAVLDGFTVTAGFAEERNGGGLFAEAGGPTIRDCTFERNLAIGDDAELTGLGAGMYASAGPIIDGCTFAENRVEARDAAYSGSGGGLACVGGNPVVTRCLFWANSAHSTALMLNGSGAGLFFHDGCEVTIRDCEFVGNVITSEGPPSGSGRWGAGASLSLNCSGIVEDCTFTSNRSFNAGGLGLAFECNVRVENCEFVENITGSAGGGMGIWQTDCDVRGCRFVRNYGAAAGGAVWSGAYVPYERHVFVGCSFIENETGPFDGQHGGGAVYGADDSIEFWNCTFTGNRTNGQYGGAIAGWGGLLKIVACSFDGNFATLHGGAVRWQGTSEIRNAVFLNNVGSRGGAYAGGGYLANCIMWDNTPESIHGGPIVTFSNVQGGWPGVGNIELDPMLDAGFRPLPGSPVIDAGANNAVPLDALDLDDDGDIKERLALDLGSNPRFADDPDTADSGCGEPVQVDMGAFEYQGVPWHPMLVGDVDGDGMVGFSDLLEVLSAWGECDPECCLADVDFSWEVNFDDLLTVLSNWS